VINGEHYAGAERVQDLLAARLPDYGVEVGFACLKPGRFASQRQARKTPLVELAMRSRFDLRPALHLARLVREDGYEVLHTHSARALLIGRFAAALCGAATVHHVHGITSSEVAGRPFTRLNAWVERKLLPTASAVIAVSSSVADYLRQVGVARERLHIVPNGVPARPSLPHKDLEPAHPTLGFIALLRPRKGLETFLEAAALLNSRGVDARLRIVGRFESGEYEREIHGLAERLGLAGAIDWRGFQQNVDAELDAMDVLVFPSVLPEGMPMVVLESMAAGVPIVASRVGGVIDVLRDGQDALLAAPAVADDLAEKIAWLVHDREMRNRLRQSAYARQRQCFSDASMAGAVANIYEQVLAIKGASV
jgi:glycosyltransferase involved in cell wall biosynthesis